MARPREFDRDTALERAIHAFWHKGFAATSTEDLTQAMGIGRQSLYNTFGDKRRLYLEALDAYQRGTNAGHLQRLNAPASPLAGIRELLLGLAGASDEQRALGCMGVASTCEFGATDADLVQLRARAGAPLRKRLVERLAEGQRLGEIDAALQPKEAAGFLQMTMTGLQVAARGGAPAGQLRRMAQFAVERLKAR